MEGVCALSESLRVNSTLKTLDLGSAQQTGEEEVRTQIQQQQQQTENKPSTEGVDALSEALKVNSGVTTLALEGWHQQPDNDKQVETIKHEAGNRKRDAG